MYIFNDNWTKSWRMYVQYSIAIQFPSFLINPFEFSSFTHLLEEWEYGQTFFHCLVCCIWPKWKFFVSIQHMSRVRHSRASHNFFLSKNSVLFCPLLSYKTDFTGAYSQKLLNRIDALNMHYLIRFNFTFRNSFPNQKENIFVGDHI